MLLDQSALQVIPLRNWPLPKEPAKSIPLLLDFVANAEYTVDLEMYQLQTKISAIRSLYIDMSGSVSDLLVTMGQTNQTIIAKAGTQGYYSILASTVSRFLFQCPGGPNNLRVFLISVPMCCVTWPPPAGPPGPDGPFFGDVTGNRLATVVSFVGGSTAALVHSAELAANAATYLNVASKIASRSINGYSKFERLGVGPLAADPLYGLDFRGTVAASTYHQATGDVDEGYYVTVQGSGGAIIGAGCRGASPVYVSKTVGTDATSIRFNNGVIDFTTNTGLVYNTPFTATTRTRMHLSGGVSIGSTFATDPGVDNVLVKGTIKSGTGFKCATLPVFLTNALAVAGGLAIGDFYRTGLDPDTVCVVH